MNADASQIIARDAATPNEAAEVAGFAPVDLYQRREKIFTRQIEGRFQRLRLYSGWPLLLGYFLVPWLEWGDRQAVLFDLPARQFHVLFVTFWPQDFVLLGALLIIAAFALFTVTSVVGRIWCGYTCPQTVWTAIYMWIEQVAEGPRHARVRLDRAPWGWEKIRKRGLKHGMWLGWAFFTGFTFVGYFTPIRELVTSLVTFEVGTWSAFWIAFFTAATYFNAGWLREQVCIYMCPYARFQSAMFDKDTLIVSYDTARGEPRGRGQSRDGLGDCIDCMLCVQVCPTGIDIRDGLQYQCIGCAHCIDACADIMTKVGKPTGLIRYTTEHELEGGRSQLLRGRVVGYGIALLVMCGVFVNVLLNRDLVGIDVLRERGELYRVEAATVRNDYALKLINKAQSATRLAIDVQASVPVEVIGATDIEIEGGEVLNVPISLVLPRDALTVPSVDVRFRICDVAGHCNEEISRFLGPVR